MADITRKVCDIDGGESEVRSISVTDGRVIRQIDVCKRCFRVLTVQMALDQGHRPVKERKTKRAFVKVEPLQGP